MLTHGEIEDDSPKRASLIVGNGRPSLAREAAAPLPGRSAWDTPGIMELPPCGLYRTTASFGSIPAGRLVYFHNHGNPGPGIYLPKEWRYNHAEFQGNGQVIEDLDLVRFLEPLPPEGFYRVVEPFHCCEKRCRLFEQEALLQLGYNADAEPILFAPELVDSMLAVPAQGWKTTLATTKNLRQLRVPISKRDNLPPQ
ncbi:MAG: hypothetical protein OEM15_06255 [Myxococcales bacterium]|nr:hypothetical protein [Myxococcales bacterium]